MNMILLLVRCNTIVELLHGLYLCDFNFVYMLLEVLYHLVYFISAILRFVSVSVSLVSVKWGFVSEMKSCIGSPSIAVSPSCPYSCVCVAIMLLCAWNKQVAAWKYVKHCWNHQRVWLKCISYIETLLLRDSKALQQLWDSDSNYHERLSRQQVGIELKLSGIIMVC